ncbi:MAG: CBS domain-containing protein [Bacilli bacterium]|jgi:CBS domain-containing protein|nr:CBS domain-containing protein [Bacilli bacterium]
MTETERFLKAFKELEDRLVVLIKADYGFVSFSHALDQVHAEHLDPLVSQEETYQFLKTASDLRNLLSHEDNIAIPTPSYCALFESYVEEICHPVKAEALMTRAENLIFAWDSTKLGELSEKMAERHLSHVPLLEDGVVKGVFSSTSFFQYFLEHQGINLTPLMTVGQLASSLDISSHLNENFVFVRAEQPAYSLLRYFNKVQAGDKRISVIFVTKNGFKDERLLGLITQADLLKLPVFERRFLKGNN